MANSYSNMAARLTREAIAQYGKLVQNNEVMAARSDQLSKKAPELSERKKHQGMEEALGQQGKQQSKKKSKKVLKQVKKSKQQQDEEKAQKIQQERERQYARLEESKARQHLSQDKERERLKEAVILSEVIGLPRCKTRRSRGYGRR